MIELSKRVIDIAKDLNVQKPIRRTLTKFLETSVDVDDPLGNKMSSGYILNVVNNVVVDICIKREEINNLVKCTVCKDTKVVTVFEQCVECHGRGLTSNILLGSSVKPWLDPCFGCDGAGEFKTLIPCQDCKTEN